MDAEAKTVLLARIRTIRRGEKRGTLKTLKIPESTYYKWRKALYEEGVSGLVRKKRKPWTPWNKLLAEEEAEIVAAAKEHTDKSPREIAVLTQAVSV